MTTLTIGRLAQATEVSVETLRYYERRGLLPEPPRAPSGYRRYGPDAVARIAFIRRAKDLGFTLEEIGELLGLRSDPQHNCDAVEAAARTAVGRVAAKVAELERIRKALDRLIADCQARRPSDECPILTSLEDR